MPITLQEVRTGLEELGLGRGDVVLVHSDLRTLGPARELVKLPNCGADLIIDAFLQTVGPEGLVVFPTFTKTFDTGQRPYTGLVFDPAETPSRVGSVTNVFRKRPDALRSFHSTHSVAAVGSRAAEFVAAPENETTFDRRGPWGKMYDWDGWICFFGTDNRTNTTVHVVEEWMGLPYMESGHAWVKGPDGQPQRIPLLQAPLGPRDFYRRSSRSEKVILDSGIVRQRAIGRANVSLMKVRELHRVLREAIIADPCLLLREENPKDEWTHKARAATIRHVREKFGQEGQKE